MNFNQRIAYLSWSVLDLFCILMYFLLISSSFKAEKHAFPNTGIRIMTIEVTVLLVRFSLSFYIFSKTKADITELITNILYILQRFSTNCPPQLSLPSVSILLFVLKII